MAWAGALRSHTPHRHQAIDLKIQTNTDALQNTNPKYGKTFRSSSSHQLDGRRASGLLDSTGANPQNPSVGPAANYLFFIFLGNGLFGLLFPFCVRLQKYKLCTYHPNKQYQIRGPHISRAISIWKEEINWDVAVSECFWCLCAFVDPYTKTKHDITQN